MTELFGDMVLQDFGEEKMFNSHSPWYAEHRVIEYKKAIPYSRVFAIDEDF